MSTVKPNLTGQVLDTVISSGIGGKTADGYGTYGVPAYKVGNRSYVNLPAQSTGVGYKGDSTVESTNYQALVDFFKANKFKLVSSGTDTNGPLNWSDNTVNFVSYATYESSNLLCMIWHVDASPTPVAAHIASLGCADKSSYETAANVLDPFYAAYNGGDIKAGKDTTFGFPTISSGADGYQNAVVLQQDPNQLDGQQAEVLYYKAPNKTTWNYFMNTRGELSCAAYSTDTLKKAFKGLPCDDATTQALKTVG